LADIPDDFDHEDDTSFTAEIQQPAAETPNPIPDFLADNSNALKLAIEADPEVSRKLADALIIFAEMEGKTKDLIRSQLHI
jgi:transaldolase